MTREFVTLSLGLLGSCLVGASAANVWANWKYDGRLEGYQVNESAPDAQCVVVYSTCDIAQGAKIERSMLSQKKIPIVTCPANVVPSLWDCIGKRMGAPVSKGAYIDYADVLVPYSDG